MPMASGTLSRTKTPVANTGAATPFTVAVAPGAVRASTLMNSREALLRGSAGAKTVSGCEVVARVTPWLTTVLTGRATVVAQALQSAAVTSTLFKANDRQLLLPPLMAPSHRRRLMYKFMRKFTRWLASRCFCQRDFRSSPRPAGLFCCARQTRG